MSDFKRDNEGVDHINVFSKSKTQLGRLLSNFAHTPFTVSDGSFESVESWWYWKKMININKTVLFPIFTEEHLSTIKNLIGKEAKEYFRSLFEDGEGDYRPTKNELKEVYLQKLKEHPEITEMLLKNQLPIAHYYMMFDKQVNADSTLWTAKLWEEIASEIKNV